SLVGELYFGDYGYKFCLEPTNDNRMMFQTETTIIPGTPNSIYGDTASGHNETQVTISSAETVSTMKHWRTYHFHDTSDSAKVKQIHRINDNDYLREDGSNLAAFLYRMKKHHQPQYKRILRTIQMVAPFFGDFYLRPTPDNTDSIHLEWTEKDQDIPFKASEFSDGTLRFILLATVLLQPKEFMPSAIIIDEPELGLHPYAISILAALIGSASHQHQLIISTQSVELVNEFEAANIILVDKKEGASTFSRLDIDYLKEWLDDYSLGELWQKNMLGGRPQ
ncbi:MAG: AAA family ATPase, partial [Psychrosphaera sp.]|nr:AAA family ATPase [Psychrosphaera sp.]